jgi:hypothetical protein
MIKSTPLSHLPAAALSPRSEMGTNMSLGDSQERRIANTLEQFYGAFLPVGRYLQRAVYTALGEEMIDCAVIQRFFTFIDMAYMTLINYVSI